jgi:hypothetical protein
LGTQVLPLHQAVDWQSPSTPQALRQVCAPQA